MTIIDLINDRLNGKEESVPPVLYKYRPFDKYALDMLENNYLYLCKAERLDDPSECMTTLSLNDYYNVATRQLSYKMVDFILEYLHPYTSEENFEEIRNLVYRTMTSDGRVRRNYLLDASFAMQELAPNVDTAPIVNWLASIPEKMNEPEMGKHIEKLLFLAYDARQEAGVCSLTELPDSPEMWANYADKSTGYCVQYSMSGYEYQADLFPVVYSDERNTDILSAILCSFLGHFILGMSNGQIQADKSHFIRLFLTKNTNWQYQKEWRILGNADERIKAPKIEAIYLGKNVSKENKEKIEKYCNRKNLLLIHK